jgi:hypothetical protein
VPAGYPADGTVVRAVAASRGPGLEDLQRRGEQQQALAVVLRATLLAEQEQLPPQVAARLLQPYQLEDEAENGAAPTPSFNAGFLLPYASPSCSS